MGLDSPWEARRRTPAPRNPLAEHSGRSDACGTTSVVRPHRAAAAVLPTLDIEARSREYLVGESRQSLTSTLSHPAVLGR